MVTIVLLLAAQVSGHALGMLPGQEALLRAHGSDFPKAAWVVAEKVPVSAQPQLGGRMLAVLTRGSKVEVADIAGQALRAGVPGAIDDVMAIAIGASGRRPAGYLRAGDLAIVETVLGRCAPSVLVFASVTGRLVAPGGDGMVAEVTVWVRDGEGVPVAVLTAPNTVPGLRTVAGLAGGMAVQVGGRVVVLDPHGVAVFTSPEAQQWSVEQATDEGFELRSPRGPTVIGF